MLQEKGDTCEKLQTGYFVALFKQFLTIFFLKYRFVEFKDLSTDYMSAAPPELL